VVYDVISNSNLTSSNIYINCFLANTVRTNSYTLAKTKNTNLCATSTQYLCQQR